MPLKYLEFKPAEQLNFGNVSHGDLMFQKSIIKHLLKSFRYDKKNLWKNKSPCYTHLNMMGTDSKATSKTDIADTLGETFCHNSSSFNYSESFRKIKTEQEKVKLNFKSQNNEIYNKDFNLDELVEAIQLSHDSATGPDEIHYQMLKHLPENSLETLLNILNYIWTNGKFPEDWTYATIIPIPKPGKDAAEPDDYRPIALTSCLCKTLERMINKRLTWFLESNNHISRFQSGFRSDNLVRLETFIRDAFIKNEHEVAVFFDMKKLMIPRGDMAF